MKNKTNRVLLAKLRLEFEEKFEYDSDFRNQKYVYINTNIEQKLYHFPSYEKNYSEFTVQYISTEQEKQSYYGYDSRCKHNVYIDANDGSLFSSIDEIEEEMFRRKMEKISKLEKSLENHYRWLNLPSESQEEIQKGIVDLKEEILNMSKELGLIEKVREYSHI